MAKYHDTVEIQFVPMVSALDRFHRRTISLIVKSLQTMEKERG